MANPRRVRDLMLPLTDYAVVREEATLLEALQALAEASLRLPAGRQAHRAVLVCNAAGEVVGKVGHLAFLRAFLPERKPTRDDALLDRAGVSDDMRASVAGAMELMDDDLFDLGARARSLRVGDLSAPVRGTIDEDATILAAIRAFLAGQTLSLLVRAGSRTVGILRLSDLFDDLARQVRDAATDG